MTRERLRCLESDSMTGHAISEQVFEILCDVRPGDLGGGAVQPPLQGCEKGEVSVEVVECPAKFLVYGFELPVCASPSLQPPQRSSHSFDTCCELMIDDFNSHAELCELQVQSLPLLKRDEFLLERLHHFIWRICGTTDRLFDYIDGVLCPLQETFRSLSGGADRVSQRALPRIEVGSGKAREVVAGQEFEGPRNLILHGACGILYNRLQAGIQPAPSVGERRFRVGDGVTRAGGAALKRGVCPLPALN